MFEGAIHVLADAFQVLVLGVFGVSGWIEWGLAIAGTAEDVEQSAPEGAGISPVALYGSLRHFFFFLFNGFYVFVVAIASELDRFLRNKPHFVQHHFQSQGILRKGGILRCGHFSSLEKGSFLVHQDSLRLKERFSRLFRRLISSWKEASVVFTSSINAWALKTDPPSAATVFCSA